MQPRIVDTNSNIRHGSIDTQFRQDVKHAQKIDISKSLLIFLIPEKSQEKKKHSVIRTVYVTTNAGN